MRASKLFTDLSKTARDLEAIDRTVRTGNPSPVVRRAKNRIVGRALARAGFWRWLWR